MGILEWLTIKEVLCILMAIVMIFCSFATFIIGETIEALETIFEAIWMAWEDLLMELQKLEVALGNIQWVNPEGQNNGIDGIYFSAEQMMTRGITDKDKPTRAPVMDRFFKEKGKFIIICNSGTVWMYNADFDNTAKGKINVTVTYWGDLPIFPANVKYHGIPKTDTYVDIGKFTDHKTDARALKKAMQEMGLTPPDGYVGHHNAFVNGRIEYVLEPVHAFFTHNGGCSIFGSGN